MNISEKVVIGARLLVLAVVGLMVVPAVQAADVTLTETLYVTNRYVHTDGPTWQDSTLEGSVGYGTALTIPNARYDQVMPLYADISSFAAANDGSCASPLFFHHRVYHDTAGGTYATDEDYAEMQAQICTQEKGSLYFKFAFIRFRQVGDDVEVTVPYVNYFENGPNWALGYDAVSYRQGNYSSVVGPIKNLVYRLRKEGEGNPNGEISESPWVLSDNYSGDYGVFAGTRRPSDETHVLAGEILNASPGSYLIITNALCQEIELVGATKGNYFSSNSNIGAGELQFWYARDRGEYIEVQVQAGRGNGTYFAWLLLSLRQDGANVLVSLLSGNYGKDAKYKYGYDCEKENRYMASYQFGLKDLVYRFKPVPQKQPLDVTLSGQNTYTGATVVSDGSQMTFEDGMTLAARDWNDPDGTAGVVLVTNASTLVTKRVNGLADNGMDLRITAGSTFRLASTSEPLSQQSRLLLDDSVLVNEIPASTGYNVHLHHLTLANGSSITCTTPDYMGFRMAGYGENGYTGLDDYIYSTGDTAKTNTITGKIILRKSSASSAGVSPCLHVVTEADLRLYPGFNWYLENENPFEIDKEGAGTLIMDGGYLGPSFTLALKEGKVWMKSFETGREPALAFDGGCFELSGNRTFTKLSLLSNSLLVIDSGSQMTVKEDAFVAGWDSGDAVLTVRFENETTSVLRFNKTLTPEQRSHLRVQLPNGKIYPAKQDVNGYIHPDPPGLVLIFR